MSKLNNRVKQVEKARGIGDKKRYLCVIETDGGYKVQSLFGGKDLHFDTRAELDEFEKRPDVELTTVTILYVSKKTAEV